MRKQGFTFIELLVALSLFLIGMISVLQIFPANRKLLNQTTHATQASFLAQQEIETIRTVPYTSLTIGTYLARSAVTTDNTSPFAMFDQQVVVEYLDTNRAVSQTDQGLKRVTVTVYWTERTFSQQYSLSTYVYH
jgi:prepilin-type N-terminal cleavage/methylation domain-containing protein